MTTLSSSSLERLTRMPHDPNVQMHIGCLAIDPQTQAPLASAPTREQVEEIMRRTRPDTPFTVLPE